MMTQCCYCVPLKAGVVISSLIWLIYGGYMTISNILNIASPDETTHKNANAFNMYYISMIVLYGLVVIGAAFGLFAVALANKFNMLLIYSKIAYGIIAIEVISSILGFTVIVLFLSPIFLTYLIIGAAFAITISVHFAMVVSAYAQQRGKKEAAVNMNNKQLNDAL
ncbi:hypothetical protein RclHR1_14330003 [Rhizophagus clarus]|uniref:Uncharacterized protein n=1 Tax=Rhizophagus clarus TaxID=94130 RepID=A0A2Z6QSY0_9GLOM|nr:hypothetical protein RclHR1_14330003 [Rhizophagus clarus]GES82196.1 hypothetical protein GLOIN_2v1879800 [Rhizophagus clarus]